MVDYNARGACGAQWPVRQTGGSRQGASMSPLPGWSGRQTCATNPGGGARPYRGREAGVTGWSCTPCQAFSSLPAPGGPGEVIAGIYCRRRIKALQPLAVGGLMAPEVALPVRLHSMQGGKTVRGLLTHRDDDLGQL